MSDQRTEAAVMLQCRHLRTKKMYIPAETPKAGYVWPSDTAHYWCICTAREKGPDGGLAHLDLCGPDRSCCSDH